MLLFFAISGIWKTLFLHQLALVSPTQEQNNLIAKGKLTIEQVREEQSFLPSSVRNQLALLSSIHEARPVNKKGEGFASKPMRYFAIAMSVSLILTIFLGIIMALKFGNRWRALFTLFIGFAIPFGIILTYSPK